MPSKSMGSASSQFLVLAALILPTCAVLTYNFNSAFKERIDNSVADFQTEKRAAGRANAVEAIKDLNLGEFGREVSQEMQRSFAILVQPPSELDSQTNEGESTASDSSQLPLILEGVAPRHQNGPVPSGLLDEKQKLTSQFRTSLPRPVSETAENVDEVAAAKPSVPNVGGYPPLLKTTTSEQDFFGLPIARYQRESWVIQNDGLIHLIPRSEILTEDILEQPFIPIQPSELVPHLRKEFGHEYHVQAESPFVFVSRKGASLYWNERFRSLHAAVKQFCRARNIRTRELDFPLVAIIFRSKEEFYAYGRANDLDVPDNCLGIYSQLTNRIYLFEDASLAGKQETIETICHEATHQLAFNLGLHQRCSDTPLWLSEGLATLFEAPAYAQPNSTGRSPWPAVRRQTWMRLIDEPQYLSQAIDSLIRNDNLFKKNPNAAYSISWGLTHYFATTQPRQFNAYLEEVRKLPPFVAFDSNARWEHFRAFFGDDVGKISIALRNHIISLR